MATPFNHNFSPDSGVNKKEHVIMNIKIRHGAIIATLYASDLREMLNMYSMCKYGSTQQEYCCFTTSADVESTFHSPKFDPIRSSVSTCIKVNGEDEDPLESVQYNVRTMSHLMCN